MVNTVRQRPWVEGQGFKRVVAMGSKVAGKLCLHKNKSICPKSLLMLAVLRSVWRQSIDYCHLTVLVCISDNIITPDSHVLVSSHHWSDYSPSARCSWCNWVVISLLHRGPQRLSCVGHSAVNLHRPSGNYQVGQGSNTKMVCWKSAMLLQPLCLSGK